MQKMPDSTLQTLEKRRKKGLTGKLRLSTGLPGSVINNITIHDVFTILLILITIIALLVL